jgi:hypothetical protein
MAARKLRDGPIIFVTSAGQCIRLDAAGKVAKTFTVGPVQTFSSIDVLPNGRVLIPQVSNGRVVEYDLDGKQVWEARVTFPTSVVRLPNGNTLVASMGSQQVLEVDRAGTPVWTHKPEGRPWRARRR